MYNDITDVPGVTVGQYTICDDTHHTGVTVIIPCEGFVYEKKPVAACYVMNGYGKTAGTIQIEELGTIETPIALTNTLNVPNVANGLISYTLEEAKKYNKEIKSINPVVGETNDSVINKIQDRAVTEEHTLIAISNAQKGVQQGSVGAGAGTVCMDLKGGIGSSSRKIKIGEESFTIGILVQSNFGRIDDLIVYGNSIGKNISEIINEKKEPERGSIMVVLGTDIPLTSRQLKRCLKRCTAGLARVGSHFGHGSGDVFLGFTNGNYMPDTGSDDFISLKAIPENYIENVFRMVVSAVEEAVVNSMIKSSSAKSLDGKIIHSLSEFV